MNSYLKQVLATDDAVLLVTVLHACGATVEVQMTTLYTSCHHCQTAAVFGNLVYFVTATVSEGQQ